MAQPARLRAGWILACEAAGAAVIGLAFALEKWYQWTGVAPSTLVNVGTGLLLAGLLFLLERRFTARAEAVVEAVDERIAQRTRKLETRLDDLQRRTDERIRQQGTRDDEAIEALDHVSFPAVTHALERVNRMHALATSVARVQASADPAGVRLGFAWGSRTPDEDRPALLVTADFSSRHGGARRNPQIQWLPTQTAEEIGARLVDMLNHDDAADQKFDWPLAISNLHRTLRVAVDSKRRASGAWHLRGLLIELVGDDWAITQEGLEGPDHGYILRKTSFPRHRDGAGRPSDLGSWIAPPHPAWASPSEWEYLISRGHELFGRDHGTEPEQPEWYPELGE
jgi:hypothetical protein